MFLPYCRQYYLEREVALSWNLAIDTMSSDFSLVSGVKYAVGLFRVT